MNVEYVHREVSNGRFDAPFRLTTAPRLLLAGIWDGLRLRCPSCQEGRLFDKGIQVNPYCPVCGAPFERPGQGDFVGAVVTAYTITAIVFMGAFGLLSWFTDMGLTSRLWASAPIVFLFVLLFYRNMKGLWIAILIPLVKWMR